MPAVGPRELLVLALVLLIVFGYKRLPEIGRSLGGGMRGFKDSLSGAPREPLEQPLPERTRARSRKRS